ncbi:unnamed protein product [Closterium sp. NIES-64]|nr:unnamed protein product [Closterium sp. NIES-64]
MERRYTTPETGTWWHEAQERDRGGRTEERWCEIFTAMLLLASPLHLFPPPPHTIPMLVPLNIGQERDRGGRTEERRCEIFTAMLLLAPPLHFFPLPPLPSPCLSL